MAEVQWIHYARARSPWYELDAAVRAEHLARFAAVRDASTAMGGTYAGTFHVRGWSDWSTVELWRFPHADAAFSHWSRLTDAGYAQWFAFANNIGLPAEVPT
ncbi:MAG: hypothetical protein QOI25_1554 [Mycobacterium sp.]|jgi:hypothetical protein|nr:hypothetical protein [Mycobacterium sp.]MDT5151972.1 hypothetical protein [Mycobacterium sp.]